VHTAYGWANEGIGPSMQAQVVIFMTYSERAWLESQLTPTILPETFLGFLQFVQANAGIVPCYIV
jgi:hypothetical protein